MNLGDTAKDIAFQHVQQKAARDILTGIEEWRTNRILTAQRRWIFELIQNAIDTARERGNKNLIIDIQAEKNGVKFRHNGGYFTLDEISAVIYGGSTKPYNPESKYIGRFGTGFLVTHVVSRVVTIKGLAMHANGTLYKFILEIDRESDDEGDISKKIELCFQQLNEAKPATENGYLFTEYIYRIRDELGKEAVRRALKELEKNVSFILAFNKNIHEIKINDQSFVRKSEKVLDSQTSRYIINEEIVYLREINYDKKIQIAVMLKKNMLQSLSGYPRIFIGMPLTETADYLHIPFVINSFHFEATKERDGLSNVDQNKILLQKAFYEYKYLIETILKDGVNFENLFNLVKISKVPEEKTKQNDIWELFNQLLVDEFKSIIKNVELVKCINGRMRAVSEVKFPARKLNSKQISDELFNEFYNLVCNLKQNVPIQSILQDWLDTITSLSKIGEIFDYNPFYSIENLRDELKDYVRKSNYPHFAEFSQHFHLENGRQFLLAFYELIDKLYSRKYIASEFINYLLPDQSGYISSVQWDGGLLYLDDGIPEFLKDIVHKIGWKLRDELVDKEFSRFDIVKQYVRNTVGTEDILKKVLDANEMRLNDEKLKEQEWNDSILGWIELFWWCIDNKKLVDKFPVVTKVKTVHDLSIEKEEIIIPFQLIEFDEKYEEIYPERRILHKIYFNDLCEDDIKSRIRMMANYKCFITMIPVYRKNLTIPQNKLLSILVDKDNISKVNHEIEALEGISYIPFWNEIIGRISDLKKGKLILKFVVKHLLRKDTHWKSEISVKCSCNLKEHKIIPSQWLASLKTDRWVPYIERTEEYEEVRRITVSKDAIENLLSKTEINDLLLAYPDAYKLFIHFGFDELDLKIKIKSIKEGKPEEGIRKLVSKLVDFSVLLGDYADDMDRFMNTIEKDPKVFLEILENTYSKLRVQSLHDDNKRIGENVERIIKNIIERNKLRVGSCYIGGDLEIWPQDGEGWDSGLVEVTPYVIEIKFTSGNRVRLSKRQAEKARASKDKYIIVVVENAYDLRDKLLNIGNSIHWKMVSLVRKHSHVIENIHEKLGDIPNVEEVEPDINGYWIKRKLWEDKESIESWILKRLKALKSPHENIAHS